MKLYYVIESYPYDGCNRPSFVGTDKRKARKHFDELVEECKKDRYGSDCIDLICVNEKSQKQTDIATFDQSVWLRDKTVKEWKKQNPGKELPVYRSSGIVCTTVPTYNPSDTYVSVKTNDREPDYDRIESELKDDDSD